MRACGAVARVQALGFQILKRVASAGGPLPKTADIVHGMTACATDEEVQVRGLRLLMVVARVHEYAAFIPLLPCITPVHDAAKRFHGNARLVKLASSFIELASIAMRAVAQNHLFYARIEHVP
jgi:hypothetical protein